MASQAPKIIFGAGSIAKFSEEDRAAFFKTLDKYDVKELDTANRYPKSEVTLGASGAGAKYVIGTKAPTLREGALGRKSILDGMANSLKDLKVDSVEVFYFHTPDPTTPIEESLSAVSELYEAGKFNHFGLSNFTPEDVQKIHDLQKAKNAVLPTVYQGNYNAVARSIETTLFPTLRRLNIAFYAYSPIAGGFLTKTAKMFEEQSHTGRWDQTNPGGRIYNSLYNKHSLLEGLDEWGTIAADLGVTRAALAYRWVRFNSILTGAVGDGVIVGSSSVSQLDETLTSFGDGPLDTETCKKIDKIWESVKDDAPVDNYTSYFAKT